MLTSARRAEIAKMVKEESAVTVAKLLERFDVSAETIRKDLLYLEKNNALVRVHGGAVQPQHAQPFREFTLRLDEHRAEKRALSRLAAKLVAEYDSIAIDAGTTSIEFAEELMKRFHSLTVVTYSMDVFERLHAYKNFTVILCGGTYLEKERSFYGAFAHKVLEDIHVRKVFICPSAVSMKKGVYDYEPQILTLQKLLMENSDEVIVLADSSKYEKTALYKVCDVKEQYIFVTDTALPEGVKQLYKENGTKLITNDDDLAAYSAQLRL